jgi:predicted NBD/HSP70 family sugar kinase
MMMKTDKKGTKSIVLQTIYKHGTITRIELTRKTGFSRATISSAIAELIEAQLVQETDLQHSSGGRPAVSLELVPKSHLIVGADLHDQTWTFGAFDLVGNPILIEKIAVESLTPEATINSLAAHIVPFIEKLNIPPLRLLGLGLPGLIDTEHGLIRSAADLGWNHIEIGKLLQKKLGWPIVVINRHKAIGLYECRYGSGKDYNQTIYIGIGTGIAAGLFLDRNLVTGAIGGAGEVGHMTIEPDGAACPCGNHGCLQSLSSGPAIEQEARRLIRFQGTQLPLHFDLQLLKVDDINRAAERGDATAVSVISKAATYLGIALANLVNIFNPEAIILGGSVPRTSSLYVQTAIKVLRQRAMSPLASATSVKNASFCEHGGALGSANFALEKHLSYSLLMGK